MHTLRAVAIEGSGVVATDAHGTQFHIEIDDQIRLRLRDGAAASGSSRKLSPREIQTHIRAGLSAEEVASLTGAPLDYIQRYEGPVLAEREYVVESALGVTVNTLPDGEVDGPHPTFGAVIGERLAQLSARGTLWVSWKEQSGGWVLKLSFTADSIDHDARWRFDPKKLTLAPLNAEAIALSQQSEIGGQLLPRLRALPNDLATRDASRFDSAVFELPEMPPSAPAETPAASEAAPAPHLEPIAYGRGRVMEARTGAISVTPESSSSEHGGTADLLEALRRRRGEREAAGFDESPQEEKSATTTASIRLLDRPKTAEREPQPERRAPERKVAERRTQVAAPERQSPSSETMPVRPARRGRTSMPSWDEIVFGARPDDEA
ncbi:septation protein SepH [Amnibacterium flavum]|uniref:DUF3071 domain-containing protein n=1 Tax=Amnibacterium flavum TaxID=2173173 RepID=A0A2V1HVC9_9MICO|nr:septation protein SepH [Amnibacterium flavum]PVZ94297.1 DUF3071 domain-containing protein [Amnibacterium flavum]